MLASLKAEEDLYGTETGWPEYIAHQRYVLRIGYTADGFTKSDLQEKVSWVLLSRYLQSPPADDSNHQKLMRRFVHGSWRQYSEIFHLTFRGAHELFPFLNMDEAQHNYRPVILESAERTLTQHLGRAATVLLAVVTEVQATYLFKGHNVNTRLHAMWRAVVGFTEGEEIYKLHYKALLEDNKLSDTPSDPL